MIHSWALLGLVSSTTVYPAATPPHPSDPHLSAFSQSRLEPFRFRVALVACSVMMTTSDEVMRRFLQESLATDRQGGRLLKKLLGDEAPGMALEHQKCIDPSISICSIYPNLSLFPISMIHMGSINISIDHHRLSSIIIYNHLSSFFFIYLCSSICELFNITVINLSLLIH